MNGSAPAQRRREFVIDRERARPVRLAEDRVRFAAAPLRLRVAATPMREVRPPMRDPRPPRTDVDDIPDLADERRRP
jgi:hypothetical protein